MVKVTSKGQVTIPQSIRDQVGLLPGTLVDFEIEGSAIRVVPVPLKRLDHRMAIDRMRGTATIKLTTDEVMAMTRGED